MLGKRRLTKPTLGIVAETGMAMAVPAGQIIEIRTPTAEENRTVDVICNGAVLMMFVSDLKTRSQPCEPQS